MNVRLEKSGFYLNDLLIKKNQTNPSEVITLLGESYREKPLLNGISLFIFDLSGIRMWSRGENLTQLQIVINEERLDENFPRNFYRGEVFMDGNNMSLPIHKSEIEARVGELVWDNDSKRFGLNIFNIDIDESKFSLWLDKNQDQVDSIYS